MSFDSLKSALVATFATAGVAFVVAFSTGYVLKRLGVDAGFIVTLVCMILLVGVVWSMLWPAMDNAYTRAWRSLLK